MGGDVTEVRFSKDIAESLMQLGDVFARFNMLLLAFKPQLDLLPAWIKASSTDPEVSAFLKASSPQQAEIAVDRYFARVKDMRERRLAREIRNDAQDRIEEAIRKASTIETMIEYCGRYKARLEGMMRQIDSSKFAGSFAPIRDVLQRTVRASYTEFTNHVRDYLIQVMPEAEAEAALVLIAEHWPAEPYAEDKTTKAPDLKVHTEAPPSPPLPPVESEQVQ